MQERRLEEELGTIPNCEPNLSSGLMELEQR